MSTYDALAPWYDLISMGSETGCMRRGVQALNLQPGEKIVEIGTGTGTATAILARAVGPSGTVHALDLSLPMLRVAQRKLLRSRYRLLRSRVLLTQADGLRLPFPDAALDAVYLGFTLETLSDEGMERMLDDCRRVLKPGGRIAVVSLALRDNPFFIVRLYQRLHERFPRAIDCRPIRLREILAAVGFSGITMYGKDIWGLAVDIGIGVR